MREQSVDARAARLQEGRARKTQRVAAAKSVRDAARRMWIRSDSLLSALVAADAAPAKVARARAKRNEHLAALTAAEQRLEHARAPRRATKQPSGVDGSLRAELAAVGAQISPLDDRSDG